ncbi:probable [NU+] prion formation protein 1 [Saccharomycodes ludwigii]|uniref:Probable [NU+] prion formation protein 1 n=1 Tax=Saccharomycodes ludwigii TaxID=36035 RepID=A0A376B9H3_9ASCO|nr:hypothetical protein SCDLUD_001140 [Saccharomycodes ludwigii]KAH3903500.1 hypothetical protein SCDLUD_001140 [Saccharomycodes ludwigii]SSD61307.1 probable [NU+] prion formation protein 1 [Saccharomycodes ludwigii]
MAPPKKFVSLDSYLDKKPEDPAMVSSPYGGYFKNPHSGGSYNNNSNNNYQANNKHNNQKNMGYQPYKNYNTHQYNNGNNGYQAYKEPETLQDNNIIKVKPKNFAVAKSATLLQSNNNANEVDKLFKDLKISDDFLKTELSLLIQSSTISECKTVILSIIDKINSMDLKYKASVIETWKLVEVITKLSKSKNSALLRESSLLFISLLANNVISGNNPQECYLCEFLPITLDSMSDKENIVKRAAQHAIDSIYGCFPVEGLVCSFFYKILEYLKSSAKWTSKIAALKLVDKLREECPSDMLELTFKDAVPILTDIATDFKPELSKHGHKTLLNFVSVLDNLDLSPRYNLIVDTLQDPTKVPNAIKSLSSVTFVAEVTESSLSLLVPILSRSLKNIGSASQEQLRQTVIVIENLTRLVNNHLEIESFIPDLEPIVKKVVEMASLPEVRDLASKALHVLNDDTELKNGRFPGRITEKQGREFLIKNLTLDYFENNETIITYITKLITLDANVNDWKSLSSYLKLFCSEEKVDNLLAKLRTTFDADRGISRDDDEAGAVEIVNADFSLAYGTRMLLNKTNLRLLKGHRYGLCGRNGAGKSTLMRSINNGQLEGFPDRNTVRTCFVEHKIQESEANMDLVTFIAQDPELGSASPEEISKALEEVGFNEERRNQSVGSLSGGWKMKLELARAMLLKADVLLLDEPTNHLDVSNVQWLEDYLLKHTNITSLLVSHDSRFLDAVCTDIIHYENKKLVYYKGNLAAFVEQKPEAKSYYTLSDSNATMRFPPPGILSGVKSNTRSVAKVTDISFSYPGATKPSLENVSCSLSLSSRVAVLGPNGAGKSTLIKLLTGELVPDSGKVEKHPNLRIGYIAQHALQHVNEHKEKTANQYLQWRYQFGEDREVVLKESRKISQQETEIMKKEIDIQDGRGKRQIEAIVGRQKYRKSFQYEIKWRYWKPKYNSWVGKEFLEKEGFGKLVQKFDDFEASREGLGYRELIPSVITKHFEGVGLDAEITNHTPLGSLSGGQLVKVVIAGAMWNNPHLLVLDEPTNYLDRDSLGALAVAIREWSGGVVMISHNNEFVGALCPEQWHVADGKLVQKGVTAIDQSRFEDGGNENAHGLKNAMAKGSNIEDDDSPANIKVRRRKKKLTRNEKKLQAERRRLRYIEWLSSPKGTPKPVNTDDEDEGDE